MQVTVVANALALNLRLPPHVHLPASRSAEARGISGAICAKSIVHVQASIQLQSEPHVHCVVLYASLWKANKVHNNAKIFVVISFLFKGLITNYSIAKICCNFLIVKNICCFFTN